jgi:imidazolonepropionase-like amidohydrolase
LLNHGSAAEALRAATVNAAEFLGISDRNGEVKRGMTADLVLIASNPLTDIRSTRRIAGVVRNGRLIIRP